LPALVTREPLVLEVFGYAVTAITVTRVGRHGLEMGSHDDCLRIDLSACVSWQIRIKPTAAHLKYLTEN
jgi:hypothetical protein